MFLCKSDNDSGLGITTTHLDLESARKDYNTNNDMVYSCDAQGRGKQPFPGLYMFTISIRL